MTSDESLPFISIIILNFNGIDILRNCLQSVLESDYPRFEVIVLDNGSTDGSVEMVRMEFPLVHIIESRKNLGFIMGNNLAISQSHGDIIVLLNNDTKVDRHWLRWIAKAANDPNVGIVGCKVYYMGTNVIQDAGSFLNPWGLSFTPDAGLLDHENDSKVVEVDWVTGAALGIKRNVLKIIGLLDTKFSPSFYEDVDLCIRAKKHGFKVVTARGAKIFHYASETWNRNVIKKAYYMTRNRIYFMLKHYRGRSLFIGLTWYYFISFITDMKKLFLRKFSTPIFYQQSPSIARKMFYIRIIETLSSYLFVPVVFLRIIFMRKN